MEGSQMIPLVFQFQYLLQNKIVYRYKFPESIAYKKLQFYSYGLLKERISKIILNQFGTASPHAMTRVREFVLASKHEMAGEIDVDESVFEVLLTECLLLQGNAHIFGEQLLLSMFQLGLQRYISSVDQRKTKWINEGKLNTFNEKYIELPMTPSPTSYSSFYGLKY
ncbi:hypothetical protein EDI_278450 [Entamoeba dispar SAW760]|uniref:Uncharacterized protein n=1 Tax=Entamoeba dispar (strain ATCC PRA-260 / SAW760) TaxID=370354 RepID=B0ECY2_ENTDS|nr:uncharacterized protein EDI_278450 [Entamoeba dispar SAW760]EDR27674.1 hypothetical protein EDI_278450 [Entamoeba dispar SAW760]|eukprot:EDR27674.1 hypothetical protein EDI_278450 [Entamoeba dispar SAW760]